MPFPSPGDLPDPGIEPGSPALQADALTSEPPGRNPSKMVGIAGGHQRADRMKTTITDKRLKHLPAMRETWVRSLGREDPLEKEMATHSSILAREIPRTEGPGGLQCLGSKSHVTDEFHFQ